MSPRNRVCQHCQQAIHYIRKTGRWYITASPDTACTSGFFTHEPLTKAALPLVAER